MSRHVFILTLTVLVVVSVAVQRGWSEPDAAPTPYDPPALYLTWIDDPTTTITIHWHSTHNALSESTVWYWELGTHGAEVEPADNGQGRDANGRMAQGSSRGLAFSDRRVHTVTLSGLSPNTTYRFRLGRSDAAEFRFRTMPATLVEPLRFVAGGDMYLQSDPEPMYRQAAGVDPAFALIGGDIAYDDAKPENIARWYEFFSIWKRTMVASDGCLIPMIVCIGNHEVLGGYDKTPLEAQPFYDAFAFPGSRGYNVLDFGDYMSLIVLDSGHTNPIAGEQTQWLEATLETRKDRPHLFAMYHVPGYPSVRDFEKARKSPEVREHWVPLFDAFGLDVAFENHDHAHKRTPRMKAGRPDETGTLYLGDGAWGVEPRPVHPADSTPYLESSHTVNHVWVTTITAHGRKHEAIDRDGVVFDSVAEAIQDPATLP